MEIVLRLVAAEEEEIVSKVFGLSQQGEPEE
jgi:hypothetical protein